MVPETLHNAADNVVLEVKVLIQIVILFIVKLFIGIKPVIKIVPAVVVLEVVTRFLFGTSIAVVPPLIIVAIKSFLVTTGMLFTDKDVKVPVVKFPVPAVVVPMLKLLIVPTVLLDVIVKPPAELKEIAPDKDPDVVKLMFPPVEFVPLALVDIEIAPPVEKLLPLEVADVDIVIGLPFAVVLTPPPLVDAKDETEIVPPVALLLL